MALTVRTTLEPHRPATAIELTEAQLEELGAGKRAPVVVTVGGRSARLRVASMGGKIFIGLSKDSRAELGVEIGDTIEATIEVDAAERTVDIPVDLAEALDAIPGARAAFDTLPFTHRKEHVRAILDAKKPETRERRIQAALAKLGFPGT